MLGSATMCISSIEGMWFMKIIFMGTGRTFLLETVSVAVLGAPLLEQKGTTV